MENIVEAFIPIIAVGGFFAWMISLSPVGKAIADRLKHGPAPERAPEQPKRRRSWSIVWSNCVERWRNWRSE